MSKRRKKQAEPKEIETEEEGQTPPEPTMEEHIREIHGDAAQPQDGLPDRAWLQEQFKTKSAAVRYLLSKGYKVKEIAKHLDMRYQHVRNVSVNQLKRGPNEDWRKPDLPDNTPDFNQFIPDKK